MAYTKTQWNAGDPITQERMLHIEQGIADAHSANYTNASDIDSLESAVGTMVSDISTAKGDIQALQQSQSDNSTYGKEGHAAWTQISGAVQIASGTPEQGNLVYSKTLNTRFSDVETLAGILQTEINDAHRGTVINDSLDKRFDDIDNNLSSFNTNFQIINDKFTNASNSSVFGNYGSVDERLEADETKINDLRTEVNDAHQSTAFERTSSPYASLDARLEDGEGRIVAIQTELSNAHESTALGKTGANAYGSIDARFEAIEEELTGANSISSRLDTIEGNVTSLSDNKINKTDIANNLTTETAGKVLDATQGKLLKDTIDNMDTAYKAANTALDGRLDAIDGGSALDTTNGTLAARVGALETEVDMTSANSRIDEALSRIEAIDNNSTGSIAGLDTRISALETEVDMTSTDSRIDTALSRIEAMDNSSTGSIAGLDNRISALETEIDMTSATSRLDDIISTVENSTTGLAATKAIADANKSAIENASTGLAATKAIADAAKATADTALQPADIVTLTNDVNTLKDKDTIVIDQPVIGSNYTEGEPNLPVGEIKANADYLIADDEGKYFYWRYINNNWELISGAGGGGSGTSSGLIVDELPNADVADENTDYFVYNENAGAYLHYRFTTIDNVKQAILIGADVSNLKQYNIEKIIDGDKTYLRLYEFNYGDGNAINLDNTAVFPWIASTSYNVDDLVLYQGYFYKCTSANSDAEWTANKWQRISDIRAVTTIELPQGGGGGSSTGAVTRFIRLAPTSITTIQNNEPIYIHFFYSCVDPSAGSFEGHYTLTDKNGVSLLTDSINSGSGTDTITTWPQDKEEGQIYNDGYGSINVAPYCVLGKNTFNLEIVTGTNESFTRTWSVDIKQLNIESNAPDSIVAEVGETIDLTYTPYGAMQKTLIVKVDGTQVKTESLGAGVTGTEQICTIPAQSVAGAHKIELQLSAYINGDTKYSESITRDYIWYNAADTNAIIISSPYRNSQITTTQYSEIVIPYTIYKANTNNFIAEYYYEYNPSGENTPFDTVTLNNTNSGTIRYIPTEASIEDNQHSTANNKVYIPNHITIKVENTTLTFDFVATPMQIDIAPVGGAVIDFNPLTLNNNSTNRLPSYLSVSDNFNWSTNWEGDNQDSGGGYRTDEDGKCFIIKAGTYAEIDYQMFKQNNIDAGDGTTKTTSAVFDNGAEMKLIFKVTNVRDASTIWLTNMGKYVSTSDTEVGIRLSAHEGCLMTDKASGDTAAELPDEYKDKVWSKTKAYAIDDIVVYKSIIYKCIKAIAAPAEGEENSWNKKAWQSLGQLETEISATNSYLYFPYSEDDKIELDININQQGNNQNFIMSYEDGVPSKAYPYNYSDGGDILYHVLNEESKIHIGSPDCDVHIYRLRIYNKSLGTNEILKNFIADGETIDERIARYNRNSVYYSPELNDGNGGYTPYKTGAATLDPYRLAERIPDVKILMLDTPRFTTGKKDFVKGSTLRCIQASGGKVYPANLEKDNWYFFNGYHAGQGTTSDNYGQSARNVDFLFECDGTNAPTKVGNLASTDFPDANYVSGVAIGANASVYDEREKTWSVASGVTPDTCTGWMEDHCKISLTHFDEETRTVVTQDTSIPNNYFNLKVNVASSENVNNALFQKRYNDFLPYTSPAKNRDSRIKNDMEFVPAVLFVRERNQDLSTHKEFNDTNWHFYALGNIGDSKKTDYTRAYDPTDINEFTIEISDNNTANSQFQSGVFYSDPTDPTTITVETQTMADNPNIDQDPMKYIYPITSEQWNAKDGNGQYINYRHKTLSSEAFDGDHSFEFRYACKGDYRDGDLINDTNGNSTVPNTDPETMAEKPYLTNDEVQFDLNRQVWEAFYEWIVTSTREQFKNEATLWFVPSAIEFFYAFTHYYTMMDNRAKNTFWHFAKTGTRRAIPIGRAVPALFHVYEESNGNGGYQPASGTFDNTKQYYTQYAFDLWVYDTDTACGIDNNGELSFPYGKEDRDYRVANQPTSGWAFNGSGSIFWRRLSDPNAEGGFADEISALMRQEDDNCFATAQHLINQFDEFQNCFPEEIWRLDIERKYIRTFTGLSIDGSLTANKQNIRFLRAMMQGRKKYQRRQWVRNQAVYFGSKYGLSNVRTAEHTIEFNIYTPSSDGVTELAVPVDQSQLVIKPYQDMYIDVAVGNSTTNLSTQDFRRAKAGERVVVDCRSGGSAQETRVYIFGGEHIAALENLAPMYTYSGSFGQGKHLKVLDLGSDNPNYNNPRFTSISINENMPLLERFSVKNCNRLAQSIDLHLSNNLREFEADGSLITGVSLPAYSNIELLHLPTTVTSVALNSARALNDFYIKNKTTGQVDYSNLITLNINDSDYSDNIDWMAIAKATLSGSINTLYLQNLNKAHIGNIEELDDFDQKKKALETTYDNQGNLIIKLVLSGNLTVTGTWSATEVDYYGGLSTSVWPRLTLNPTGIEQTKWPVYYQYSYIEDGQTVSASKTIYINDGTIAPDIYYTGVISRPEKANTVKYTYTFGEYDGGDYIPYSGWKLSNGSSHLTDAPLISGPTTLQAWFDTTTRTYPIKWYLYPNKTGLVKTSEDLIEYEAGANQEAPSTIDIHNLGYATATVNINSNNNTATYSIFKGWQELPNCIHPLATDTSFDIFADWETQTVSLSEMFASNNLSNLTPEQLLVLSAMDDNQKRTLGIYNKIQSGITTMEYTTGQDSIKEGTLLVGNSTTPVYRADRTRTILGDGLVTDVQPFNETNDAFTIAIDYSFNPDWVYNGTVGILASCYERNISANTANGFILYYNTNAQAGTVGPRIAFGNIFKNDTEALNQSVAIGNAVSAAYRNIVVIRHPADSDTLYIYSGLSGDNGLPTEVVISNKTWNKAKFNTYLRFGCLIDQYSLNNDSNYSSLRNTVDYGGGTIYWAKYWNEDLGLGECKKLAMWPHEKMTYLLTNLTTTATANNRTSPTGAAPIPSVYLTSLTASIHGLIAQGSAGGSAVSWEVEPARAITNKRAYLGLPTKLQSILCKKENESREMIRTSGVYSFNASSSVVTRDYLYLLSGCNVTESNLSNKPGYNYASEDIDALKPFSHLDTTSVEVKKYNASNQTWDTFTPNNYYEYLNLRFALKPINWSNKLRIFIDANRDITNASASISTLRAGDIFIDGGEGDGQAYMYVTNTDRQNLGVYVSSNSKFTDSNGGWTPSYPYWLRSVALAGNQSNAGYLTVNTAGYMNSQAVRTGNDSYVYANLNYSMAI